MIKKWIYAIKVKSWPKILVPFLLGNSIGIYMTEEAALWFVLLWGGLATVLGIAFIVLMNDWGDQKVDKIKREMFPNGCSPKTIPDGILPANYLVIGGVFSGIVSFVLICFTGLSILSPREHLFALATASCFTFIAYTLPPLKLNYRGGGELLEMIGVGYILPLFMCYLQSGMLFSSEIQWLLAPYVLFSLTSAIASGFSDEESDKLGGKRTFVTLTSNALAHQLIETVFVAAALTSIISIFFIHSILIKGMLIMVQGVLWFYFYKMRQWKSLAVTNAFKAQGMFKLNLHKAIWYYGIAISLACFLDYLFLK